MSPVDNRTPPVDRGACVQCHLIATLDTLARCTACAALEAAHKEAG